MSEKKPMPELLPCLLRPKAIPTHEHTVHHSHHWICAKMPDFQIIIGGHKTERGARNAWNRLMEKLNEHI